SSNPLIRRAHRRGTSQFDHRLPVADSFDVATDAAERRPAEASTQLAAGLVVGSRVAETVEGLVGGFVSHSAPPSPAPTPPALAFHRTAPGRLPRSLPSPQARAKPARAGCDVRRRRGMTSG